MRFSLVRKQSGIFSSLAAALVSAIILCSCDSPPADPSLLAQVGQTVITTSDLERFEVDLPTPGAHRENLQTLVDRQILLLEARSRRLDEDSKVLERLSGDEVDRLVDEAMRLRVLQQATVTAQEIEQAYQTRGWGEQVSGLEIYVPDQARAQQVLELLEQGTDFAEAGRLHAVDFFMKIPTGGPRSFSHFPFDKPENVVKAAFALAVNEVSAPLAFMNGFVVIKALERHTVEFAEVEVKIGKALVNERKKLLRGAYLQQLNQSLELNFEPEGLDLVVKTLQAAGGLDWLSVPQRQVPVYTYGDSVVDVAQVVELVKAGKDSWAKIEPEAVIAELKNGVLPDHLMELDARQQELDQSPEFRQWSRRKKENLMLSRLQELVAQKQVEITDPEIEAYYQENKKRFRISAWARVRDLLVEDAEQGRKLLLQVREGADFTELIKKHSIRENAPGGIIRVFPIQATIYGEAWMNAVMNQPLNQIQGLIKNKGGYSIFEVIEREPERYHGLEQPRVRRAIIRDLRRVKERQLFNQLLLDLRVKYTNQVEVFEDNLNALKQASPPNTDP